MRLVLPNGEMVDDELRLFREIVAPVDDRFGAIQELINRDPEYAAMADYFYVAEHLIGIVLAAAQAYFVAAAREHGCQKSQVLAIGPAHSCGLSVASLVNHGANFWKHADEWDWDAQDRRRDVILTAFRSVGIDEEDNAPLLCLLIASVGHRQARLRDLVPLMSRWRDALERAFPDGR